MDFTNCPIDANEVLKLISRTRIGNEVLEQFLPRLRKGEVRIAGYPPEVLERLKLAIGRDQPVGACFIPEYKGETREGTIYLDLTSPLGLLAPFLFHEMVHSLDPGVWDAARRPLTRKSRDRVLLEAETKAFEAQHQFVLELKQRFPEYQRFLQTQYPRAKILHERLTATDVAELYGFKIA